jgi:hypothetical protein
MESDKPILNLILKKLESLENAQTKLEKKLDDVLLNTKRMENHIDFVENTYNKVKTPFHYLMDKVSVLSFSPFNKKSEISNKEIVSNKEKEEKE